MDGFKNDDEWIRFLKDKIKSKLGLKFLETFIKIGRKSKEKSIGIVRCAALPQNEHCLLEDKLYVRKGPSSHELPVKEALNWFQNRVQKVNSLAKKIIHNSKSFKELNKTLEKLTKTNKSKLAGDIFEYLTKLYLEISLSINQNLIKFIY